jgi:hypothetical protein
MSSANGIVTRTMLAGQVFVLLLCLWPQGTGAGESPLEVIRTTTPYDCSDARK